MSADPRSILQQVHSPYVYSDSCYKQAAKTIAEADLANSKRTLSKLDVIYLYDKNYFTDSDLHIVNIIANNVFCTVPMIERSITHYRSIYMGSSEITLIDSMEHLKPRLGNLIKAQILSKYTFSVPFVNEGTTKLRNMAYYLVTPHGYNFLKRVLNFNGNYDEYLAITPIDDVFKYLSTVTVCQSLYNIRGFSNYSVDLPYYIKDERKRTKLFGKTSLLNGDKKFSIVVEPIKFKYNKFRMSEKDWINNIIERLGVLKNYIHNKIIKGEYDNFCIMLVCDDIPGIQNACILANEHLKDHLPYLYFTIDVAVSKYGFENTCIQLTNNKEMNFVVPKFL